MASEIDFVLLDTIMKVLLFVAVHIIILKVIADAYDHIKRNKFRYRIIATLFFNSLYTSIIYYSIFFSDENFMARIYILPYGYIETYYEKMFSLLICWTMLYIGYALIVFGMAVYTLVTTKKS